MDVNAPELDWLVSVDDHVIEPPNVWVDRAPAKWRDDVPRLVDDAVGLRREEGRHLRACRSRSGSARRSSRRTPCRTRRCPRPRTTPSRGSSTWTAPGSSARCASRRSRASAGRCSGRRKDKDLALHVRAVLQRLDDRRVVRHRARSLHPADHHPALGPGSRGRRRWSDARPRARPRSRSPRTPSRSACPPSTTRTATGTRSWRRRRTCRWSCACTSARRRRCRRSRPTRPGSPTSPSARSAPRARCSRGCSATSSSACPA